MSDRVRIEGIDDVNEMLSRIAPRHAKNIMRATIHGIAGTIRNDAKKMVPVDEGTVKKAIKAKRERVVGGRIQSSVRVGPEAFYWRFLEYGQGPDGVESAMFFKAFEKYRQNANQIMIEQFGKKWEAALRRAARRNGG